MALIECKNCGHMISEQATKCPICGCPVLNGMSQYQQYQQPDSQPVYYQKKNNYNKILYAIIALLLAILVIFGLFFLHKNNQMEKDYQQKLMADSLTKDSLVKVEKALQDSIDQAKSAPKQQQQTQPKAPTGKPQYYGQVSDPDGYTNIRRGPGTNYPIVRRYNSGDYLYYTPQGNGWSLVYSGDKASTYMGYMHTSRIIKINPNQGSSYNYNSSSGSSPSSNYHEGYIVDPVDNYVNIRKGPGTNYAIVGRLDTYTDVYYTTTSTNWHKVYDRNYNYLGYVYHDRIKKTR